MTTHGVVEADGQAHRLLLLVQTSVCFECTRLLPLEWVVLSPMWCQNETPQVARSSISLVDVVVLTSTYEEVAIVKCCQNEVREIDFFEE